MLEFAEYCQWLESAIGDVWQGGGWAAIMIRIDCRGVSTDALASSEEIRAATDCFVKHGYAILDHVVPADRIRALNLEFLIHPR